MKTIETQISPNWVSRGRWLLKALQSSVVGMILAGPAAAQEMNKSGKGHEKSKDGKAATLP